MSFQNQQISKGVMGAWLIHHDQKLTQSSTTAFEKIATAGRAARLLSVVSKESQWAVSEERVVALANGIGIRELEMRGLLHELQSHGLIDHGQNGISVLGVTQARLLDHANDIFEAKSPSGIEYAAIDLSERGSHSPVRRMDCQEEISDTYKLSSSETDDLFNLSESIGFVDYEESGVDRLYFNGSLFRRDQAKKAKMILDNIEPAEQQRLLEAEALLKQRGCVPAAQLQNILGPTLWSKMHQIGYFEVSIVSNEKGETHFVTKPEALNKYAPNGLVDVLDDAKALSSSLTYGVVKSSNARGRIKLPETLVNKLVSRGYVEGWAPAIAQDYKILERRGVVKVTHSSKGHRLTLLKPEVGEMAKDLMVRGDASQAVAEVVIGSTASYFTGPEFSRSVERKKEIPQAKSAAARALNILRKSS